MKSYSINIKNMIYFPAISPAILTMCNAIVKSSVTAFLVIFAGTMDVKNIGLYFTIQAATIFVFRPLVSNMADRLGTLKVLIPCEIINVIALIIISISRSLPMFLFAAVLMGISIAGEQPILMAECVKTADRSKRGSASNTSYVGVDIGNFVGSNLAGFMVAYLGFRNMYRLITLPIIVCTIFYSYYYLKQEKRKKRQLTK